MSNKFIMKRASKINWELNREDLSTREWPKEFIEENDDCFIWDTLPIVHTKDPKFIYRYRDRLNWGSLSNELRNEKFITVFFKYVHWDNLPTKDWTDDFVIRHMARLHWPNVRVDKLSEDTLDKCSKYLIWPRVSRREHLSEEFIRRHRNEVDWSVIAHRKDLSKKFKKEFAGKIRPHIRDVRQATADTEEDYINKLEDPRNQRFMGNYR